VKHSAIFLLILLLTPLLATDGADFELIELQLENLQESWWQELLSPIAAVLRPQIRLGTRFSLSDLDDPDRFSLNSALSYTYPRYSFHANLKQVNSGGITSFNLAAQYKTDHQYFRRVLFGEYGVTFGQGICIKGYGSAIVKTAAYTLNSPTDPQRYQPLGVVAEAGWDSLRILAFLSQRRRAITLDGDRISNLYRSRTENTHLTTDERVTGLALSHRIKHWDVGLLFYYQYYDRSFADTLTTMPSHALSAYAGYAKGIISSSTEITLLDGHLPALQSTFEIESKPLRQTISIATYPDAQTLAYAGRLFLLRNSAARQELQYKLDLKVSSRTGISFGTVHNRADRLNDKPRWLDRQILTGEWKHEATRIRISFLRFDKHLVTSPDLTPLLQTDDQYRLRIYAQQPISKRWQNQLTCVYNLENRANLERNGILIDNRFVYRSQTHRLSVGAKTWQTQNTIYDYSSDDSATIPYEQYFRDNLNLYAAYTYRFKYGNLSLRCEQELRHARRTRIYTGLTLSF